MEKGIKRSRQTQWCWRFFAKSIPDYHLLLLNNLRQLFWALDYYDDACFALTVKTTILCKSVFGHAGILIISQSVYRVPPKDLCLRSDLWNIQPPQILINVETVKQVLR